MNTYIIVVTLTHLASGARDALLEDVRRVVANRYGDPYFSGEVGAIYTNAFGDRHREPAYTVAFTIEDPDPEILIEDLRAALRQVGEDHKSPGSISLTVGETVDV